MSTMGRVVAVAAASATLTVDAQSPAVSSLTAGVHHQRGVEYHLQRRLDEASREYARALALEPARAVTRAELEIIRRFAPRVYAAANEPFALKDVAAVLHPRERLIAYHFFWDDDIDFPDDNDPCDHELVWVRYGADGSSLERFWTYFHGRILDGGAAALEDARRHDGRPLVNVQWGKHGSMPAGWEQLRIVADRNDIERDYLTLDHSMTLAEYNRGTWQKLSVVGRRAQDHPLARRLGWPDRFRGEWGSFVDFSRAVDLRRLLDDRQLATVSRWNSAVINQQFLAYNFRPKTEWPPESSNGPTRVDAGRSAEPLVRATSIDDFQLPAKDIFDRTMPRYPNIWFYVDASLTDSYAAAVRLVADALRGPMRLRELYGPFSNPEGCDFEVRLEHLQPWEPADQRPLHHAHAFHMRYYYSALERAGLERVTLRTTDGARRFHRVAASAHYEVEHSNPNHADVESCPICGRTGTYENLEGNLVELVHDPLGVELLLRGTVRDEAVAFEDDGVAVGSVLSLADRFIVEQRIFAAQSGDRNTLRIGVVVITSTR